ncbi:hypothetical protein L917_01795 [Phytophthora nicotianae]|uniref:Uncharacterized protein n=1 Tax=Phytophthora nicotianae TaxID=4792 RepID=W2LW12_PHYNI|nr:hypothetical protein L917_01795 [Phytophthora nicotianae]
MKEVGLLLRVPKNTASRLWKRAKNNTALYGVYEAPFMKRKSSNDKSLQNNILYQPKEDSFSLFTKDFHGSGVSQLEEDAVIDDYSVNHDDAVLRGRDGGTCEMKQNRTGARYG